MKHLSCWCYLLPIIFRFLEILSSRSFFIFVKYGFGGYQTDILILPTLIYGRWNNTNVWKGSTFCFLYFPSFFFFNSLKWTRFLKTSKYKPPHFQAILWDLCNSSRIRLFIRLLHREWSPWSKQRLGFLCSIVWEKVCCFVDINS